jgi:hypothetical protein
MDQNQTSENSQSPDPQANQSQSQTEVTNVNEALDAATLAAGAIAKASGFQSLEQVASALVALESRVKAIEPFLPAVQDLLSELKDAIPPTFVSRVENFLESHFPVFGRPAEEKPQADEAKTE